MGARQGSSWDSLTTRGDISSPGWFAGREYTFVPDVQPPRLTKGQDADNLDFEELLRRVIQHHSIALLEGFRRHLQLGATKVFSHPSVVTFVEDGNVFVSGLPILSSEYPSRGTQSLARALMRRRICDHHDRYKDRQTKPQGHGRPCSGWSWSSIRNNFRQIE